MSQDRVRGILEGIIHAACRQHSIPSTDFRAKVGGSVLKRENVADWYVSIQNSDASTNTQRAMDEKLVRRCYAATQKTPDAPVMLKIHEWSHAQDGPNGEYRTIFKKPADDMGARIEMMRHFIASYAELK